MNQVLQDKRAASPIKETAYLATSVSQAGIIRLGSDANQFKSGDNIRSEILSFVEKCDVVFKEIVHEIVHL